MYTDRNFQSKKAMKEAVATGEVSVYDNSLFANGRPINGDVTVAGPHFPQPHRWYARVRVVEGIVVKVLS